MGRLFIAEKPSVATAIAQELGITGKGQGYTVCGNDIVSSCFGHLFEMAAPEYYDPAYKRWDMAHLPIIPARWHVMPTGKGADRITLLGKLMKDANQVINAGDPDNEGQYLVDQVITHFNYRGPVLRYWSSAADPESVNNALSNMQDNRGFVGMANAAIARGRCDWLIGMNGSRAFTIRAQVRGGSGVRPVGRVQTPMLEMVDERCRRVAHFKPIPYHLVIAHFQHAGGTFSGRWQPREDQPGLDDEGRLTDTATANSLIDSLVNTVGTINTFETKAKTINQPLGLSLAGIGLLASNTFGFGAAQTLEICQSLYQVHKLTTYPRGDCEYLPESMHAHAVDVLEAVAVNLPDIRPWVEAADPQIKSPTWNDTKITAHHAIIPTAVRGHMASLQQAEAMVYQLIVRHYIAQFFSAHQFDATTVRVHAGNELFGASGKVIIEPGWKQLFQETPDENDDSQQLPTMAADDLVTVLGAERKDAKTKPPKLFTEGTLPVAMEKIHSYVDDPIDKAALREGDGIGTPATRGAIIEECKRRGFLETQGKYIVSTQACRELLANLPAGVKSPVLTAQFQRELKLIEVGKSSIDTFMAGQIEFVRDLVNLAKADLPEVHRMSCPACGEGEFRRVSRKAGDGYFWSCSAWREGCKFTASDNEGRPNLGPTQTDV